MYVGYRIILYTVAMGTYTDMMREYMRYLLIVFNIFDREFDGIRVF